MYRRELPTVFTVRTFRDRAGSASCTRADGASRCSPSSGRLCGGPARRRSSYSRHHRRHPLHARARGLAQVSVLDHVQARSEPETPRQRRQAGNRSSRRNRGRPVAKGARLPAAITLRPPPSDLDCGSGICSTAHSELGAQRPRLLEHSSNYAGRSTNQEAPAIGEQLRRERKRSGASRGGSPRCRRPLVLPDFYGGCEPCMVGWGRTAWWSRRTAYVFALQAATSEPGAASSANVREHTLEWIWNESDAFRARRGRLDHKPCRACPHGRPEVDRGGGRCHGVCGDGRTRRPRIRSAVRAAPRPRRPRRAIPRRRTGSSIAL